MRFAVRYSASARDDLKRLYQYLLDHSTTVEDLELAERALDAVVKAAEGLSRSPFIYRKAGTSPFLRELLIPFGNSGYVSLFEIEDASDTDRAGPGDVLTIVGQFSHCRNVAGAGPVEGCSGAVHGRA